ncbi:MAG TPA: glycosyltransferase 87 family protein [Allosphingosinicella sp.]|nr:glycosyltransferase 87 family protein [Allosphingosinicella sp.]
MAAESPLSPLDRAARAIVRAGEAAAVPFVPVAALAAVAVFLPVGQDAQDMVNFLIPWMEEVRRGGLGGLSGEFSNYSPPYIYLLYLVSWRVPIIGTVPAIKLIGLPFVFLASAAIYGIVSDSTGSRVRAAAAAALWLLPTLMVNAFYWGQADIIYAAFLLWFVRWSIADRPGAAALAFGIALSFKLQAMFVSPLLLYLLLHRRLRPYHLALIPAAWTALMIPPSLQGGRGPSA